MTLLKPGRSICAECSVEKTGCFVTDDRQGTRVFYCLDHFMAALRKRLIPLRTVSHES